MELFGAELSPWNKFSCLEVSETFPFGNGPFSGNIYFDFKSKNLKHQNLPPNKRLRGIGVQVLDSACPTLEGNQICVSSKSAAIRCMGKSGGRIQKNLLKSWERKHALVIGTWAASVCRSGIVPKRWQACSNPGKQNKQQMYCRKFEGFLRKDSALFGLVIFRDPCMFKSVFLLHVYV